MNFCRKFIVSYRERRLRNLSPKNLRAAGLEKFEQFVSRRFEGIALQYFHRMAVRGKMPDIGDFDSYWYDDPVNKTNGEFDCVIKRTGNLYDFYECKFFDRLMTLQECEQEKDQLQKMQGIIRRFMCKFWLRTE